jgi:hypothetical protein
MGWCLGCGSTAATTASVATSSPDAGSEAGAVDAPIGPFDRHVEAADVSLLYPIAATTRPEALIGADERGAYGALVPTSLVDESGAATGVPSRASLRLVGVRFDPCSAHGGCAPEVRAIFQPLTVGASLSVDDAAVHVFYAVPAAELVAMLEQLLALKAAYGAGIAYPSALGPQPILAATGLDGAFAAGLRALWLAHLGELRATRVTTMVHENLDGDFWSFSRFDRAGGALVATSVVGTESSTQRVGGSSALTDAIGGIDPSSTVTMPALGPIVSSGRPLAADGSISAGFAAAIDAAHPLRHDSENTDCVSCHVAEGAHRVGREVYGLDDADAFTSERSLAYRRDARAMTNFHAFGYLGTSVSVMQRTANESAVVADAMERAIGR